jgi:carbonic anhydrase
LPGAGKTVDAELDPTTLLPRHLAYYHYMGSLTTPPCSEGVKWFVATEPMPIGSKQVDQFVSLVNFNARPVQPLATRRVLKSTR